MPWGQGSWMKLSKASSLCCAPHLVPPSSFRTLHASRQQTQFDFSTGQALPVFLFFEEEEKGEWEHRDGSIVLLPPGSATSTWTEFNRTRLNSCCQRPQFPQVKGRLDLISCMSWLVHMQEKTASYTSKQQAQVCVKSEMHASHYSSSHHYLFPLFMRRSNISHLYSLCSSWGVKSLTCFSFIIIHIVLARSILIIQKTNVSDTETEMSWVGKYPLFDCRGHT